MNDPIKSFIIFSNFGCFRDPSQNKDMFLSFDSIPRPSILGVLGAVAGIEGYNSRKNPPPFYSALTGLKLGVQPLRWRTHYPILASDFEIRWGNIFKMAVTFNNMHGFGSNEASGNWMITEQVLIEPAFRIYMQQGGVDGDCYSRLIKHLENKTTIYSPYMGKNEFPLTLIYEGAQQATKVDDFDSTFPITTILPTTVIDGIPEPGVLDAHFTFFWNPIGLIDQQYKMEKVGFGNYSVKLNKTKLTEKGCEVFHLPELDINVLLF